GIVTRRNSNTPIPEVRITVTRGGAGVLPGRAGEIAPLQRPSNSSNSVPETTQPSTAQSSSESAVTDSAGHFILTGVPVGTVRVRAELEGYFGPLVDGEYASFAAISVSVSPDRPTNVAMSLIPSSAISGRVL